MRVEHYKPETLTTLLKLGNYLLNDNKPDKAISVYRKILTLDPKHFGAAHNLGIAYKNRGDYQNAIKIFRQILKRKPNYYSAYWAICNCIQYDSPHHSDVENIKSLLSRIPDDPQKSALLHFSLGKIFDDCAHFDKAFIHYQQANLLMYDLLPRKEEVLIRYSDTIIDNFNESLFANFSGCGSPSNNPCFIVGLPRSGKTLLENLISAHPLVHGAGELQTIENMANKISSYPCNLDRVTPDQLRNFAQMYLKKIRCDTDSCQRQVVNTLPNNIFYLGLIALLFPNARIIHCTRSSLDTCLSIFFSYYSESQNYYYNLNSIALYYQQYHRLIDHWRNTLPMEILTIKYEDTIKSPLEITKRVLGFLGLEWNTECLSLPPVHDRQIDHWKHYRRYLDPLFDYPGLTE